MADAKSRYEIVESLTEQRQNVIDEITGLKDRKRQERDGIGQLERNHTRQAEELERKHKQEMEDRVAAVDSFESGADVRMEDLKSKEGALKEAIEALKAISDTQATKQPAKAAA